MAQQPSPVAPNVEESSAPTPQLDSRPPPLAFGGNVAGTGLEAVGAAADTTSAALQQHALAYQAINNKQAADASSQTAAQSMADIQNEFRANNRGMSAADNLHEAYSAIETARVSNGAGLTPLAQVQYDDYTRRAATYAINDLKTYAVGQRQEAIKTTATDSINLAGQQFALNADVDYDGAKAGFLQTVGQQTQQILAGYNLKPDDPQVRATMLQYTSPIAGAVVRQAYDAGNLTEANRRLSDLQTLMTPEVYTTASGGLRAANSANLIQSAAQTAIRGGDWVPPNAGSPSYVQGIHGREGTAPNPNSSADGIGQFTEGTWQSVMKLPQFAQDVAGKSPQQVLDLRHNPAIADEAIVAYGQQNAATLQHDMGIAPSSAQVAMAHGYGPGGAEAILRADPSTPMSAIIGADTAANNRVANMTAGQVVAQFTSRFGTQPFGSDSAAPKPIHFDPVMAITPSTDPATYQAAADQRALAASQQLFPNNAEQQQRFLAAAHQVAQFNVASLDASQKADYDKMDQFVTSNNVQDPVALQAQFPTEWGNAPAKYQAALEKQLQFNARVVTPERAANVDRLNGMFATAGVNPQPFLSADIRSMDLPLGIKSEFLKKQATLGQSKTQDDTVVDHALKSTQGQAALQSVGLLHPAPETRDQYYQFAGALQSEVEAFRTAHANQPPTDKDIAGMLSQITAKTGQQSLFGVTYNQGTPAFQVPPAEVAKIQQSFAARGLGNPSPEQIGELYRSTHRGQP